MAELKAKASFQFDLQALTALLQVIKSAIPAGISLIECKATGHRASRSHELMNALWLITVGTSPLQLMTSNSHNADSHRAPLPKALIPALCMITFGRSRHLKLELRADKRVRKHHPCPSRSHRFALTAWYDGQLGPPQICKDTSNLLPTGPSRGARQHGGKSAQRLRFLGREDTRHKEAHASRSKCRVAAFRFWMGFLFLTSAMARDSEMPTGAHASAETAWFPHC